MIQLIGPGVEYSAIWMHYCWIEKVFNIGIRKLWLFVYVELDHKRGGFSGNKQTYKHSSLYISTVDIVNSTKWACE